MSINLVHSNLKNSNNSNLRNKSISPENVIQYKKIGNYVLSNTIGAGTFSKVKLGIHLPTNQKVAIKILDREKIKNDYDVERISREIHILQELRHPNIVQLYEAITSERHIYIVMEYVEGNHLFKYIYSENFIPERKASFFFRQLISAVEYIHTLGIVHRDIKPDNILLDKKKKTIKLVDFGLSNSYRHGDLIETACGSPCYASPEMISGNPYNGLSSDLWSCGVVLYCMVVGKLPFEDENMIKLYQKINTANYIMPEYLSNYTKDFLRKIFKTNPDKRIKLNEIKKHPFYLLGMQNDEVFSKGIFIGNEEIPVDKHLVSEIKQRFYYERNKITEQYIIKNIRENKHNNLTTIYYLLLKQNKEEEEESKSNKKNIKNDIFSPKSNNGIIIKKNNKIFNLSTIKRINFDNSKEQTRQTTEIPKNFSINNNNINKGNEFNVVVINNILSNSIQKTPSKNKIKNNSVTVNVDSQMKMNTLTSDNNNTITTKINIDDVISNQLMKPKHNSRNISNFAQLRKNKTFTSSIGYNNNESNEQTNYFSFNLNNTLNAYRTKAPNNKEINRGKFLFRSPNCSKGGLSLFKKNNKNFFGEFNKIIFFLKKTTSTKKQYNTTSNKKAHREQNGNKFLMKKIFENESFISQKGVNNRNTIDITRNLKKNNKMNLNGMKDVTYNLNKTCDIMSNINKKMISKINKHKRENNITNLSLVKHSLHSIDLSYKKGETNNRKVSLINGNTPTNIHLNTSTNKEKKLGRNEHNYFNLILSNNFSLSINKSKSKDKTLNTIKKSKNNSLNKKKITSNINTLNTKNGKNKISFNFVNFSNVVRKNIKKEKTQSNNIVFNTNSPKKTNSHGKNTNKAKIINQN